MSDVEFMFNELRVVMNVVYLSFSFIASPLSSPKERISEELK